jgi:type IIS restriction enzyme R protein
LASVEWGKYRIDDLFKIQTSAKRFDANKVNIIENGRYPYVVRTSSNNGQKGFLDENESFLNAENTISFGQDTATIFYQEKCCLPRKTQKVGNHGISRNKAG